MDLASAIKPRQLTKWQIRERVKSKPTKPSATIQSKPGARSEPKWEHEGIEAAVNPRTDAEHRQVARYEKQKLEIEQEASETARQRRRRKQDLKRLRGRLFNQVGS
jgi:hypothetical protein